MMNKLDIMIFLHYSIEAINVLIEHAVGGLCQHCGFNRCLLRYGSPGYYLYEACPKCGFAFSECANDLGDTIIHWNKVVWDNIEEVEGFTRKQFYEINKVIPDEKCDYLNMPTWKCSFNYLKSAIENLILQRMEVYE
jgi:hypothetical protein